MSCLGKVFVLPRVVAKVQVVSRAKFTRDHRIGNGECTAIVCAEERVFSAHVFAWYWAVFCNQDRHIEVSRGIIISWRGWWTSADILNSGKESAPDLVGVSYSYEAMTDS